MSKCVYCGFPAEHRDHTIPCAWTGVRTFAVKTVPACTECNLTLSDVPLFTIEDRRWHIIQRLRKRIVRYVRQRKYERAAELSDRVEGAVAIQRAEGYHTSPPIYVEEKVDE
jgi:hypothetical protein